jgi:hypothetical protein
MTSAQNAGVMKKFIGTHLAADESRSIGLLAAAAGLSKSAFIRSLIQAAIRSARRKGKEAA